jgi:hypothetical protein
MQKDFQKTGKKGIVKRTSRRVLGVFIDGTSLDRATKRMHKRIDLAGLVKGVSAGMTPIVARYYTLIPYEDDSRQLAFLDAVRSAGLEVVIKRLPPKGITRQVTVDIQMASDMIAFGLGQNSFKDIGYNFRGANNEEDKLAVDVDTQATAEEPTPLPAKNDLPEKRIVTAICPPRDLSYAFSLLSSLQVETVTVDFGEASGRELLKSASRWIDLSTAESIWL